MSAISASGSRASRSRAASTSLVRLSARSLRWRRRRPGGFAAIEPHNKGDAVSELFLVRTQTVSFFRVVPWEIPNPIVHNDCEEHSLTTQVNIQEWRGAKAVDVSGEKVGTVEEVYLDRRSQEPEWLTISTGLFGTRTSFVPVADAQLDAGEVRLGYAKDQIKDAPNVDADGALSPDEEQRLYEHYGRGDYADWNGADTEAGDAERTPTGRDVSGPETDK